MVDIEPIPLAGGDGQARRETESPLPPIERMGWTRTAPPAVNHGRPHFRFVVVLALGVAHGLAIWWGLGGREGLTNGWPLWRDDHSLYYHSALVTRSFLRQSGTTAGYDPCLHGGIRQERGLPRLLDAPRARHLRLLAAIIPSSPTSSTS